MPEVCPVNAITLVFGTEKRGVDIPNVAEDFQTYVPGIYIAGELGGMGLMRNAIEQGRQAIDSIRRRPGPATAMLDLVIVGWDRPACPRASRRWSTSFAPSRSNRSRSAAPYSISRAASWS